MAVPGRIPKLLKLNWDELFGETHDPRWNT